MEDDEEEEGPANAMDLLTLAHMIFLAFMFFMLLVTSMAIIKYRRAHRQRNINAVPRNYIPITRKDLTKKMHQVILPEIARSAETELSPEVDLDTANHQVSVGRNDRGRVVKKYTHFKTSIAKSFFVIEEAVVHRFPHLARKPSQSIREWIDFLQVSTSCLDADLCDYYVNAYEEARFSEFEYTQEEYRDFMEHTVLSLVQSFERKQRTTSGKPGQRGIKPFDRRPSATTGTLRVEDGARTRLDSLRSDGSEETRKGRLGRSEVRRRSGRRLGSLSVSRKKFNGPSSMEDRRLTATSSFRDSRFGFDGSEEDLMGSSKFRGHPRRSRLLASGDSFHRDSTPLRFGQSRRRDSGSIMDMLGEPADLMDDDHLRPGHESTTDPFEGIPLVRHGSAGFLIPPDRQPNFLRRSSEQSMNQSETSFEPQDRSEEERERRGRFARSAGRQLSETSSAGQAGGELVSEKDEVKDHERDKDQRAPRRRFLGKFGRGKLDSEDREDIKEAPKEAPTDGMESIGLPVPLERQRFAGNKYGNGSNPSIR